MSNYLRYLVLIPCLLVCAVPAAARAQSVVTLSGTVGDANGAPIAGATVTVRPGRGPSTHTDARGTFEIDNLTAGTYSVTASKPGYVDTTLVDVVVNASSARVALVLSAATLSSLEEIAHVQSRQGQFNDSASAVTNVSRATFRDQGQIQIGHVLDQTPGIVSARPGSADAAVPGSITSPNLRGALDYEKATLLDGHPLINGKNGDYPTMLVNSMLFDSIEAVEGPTAFAPEINYGIGGTLNFRTADPSLHPQGEVSVGMDNTSGAFSDLRFSSTTPNGRLGYLIDLVSYGTQGPLHEYPSYVALPSGATINGYGKISGTTASTSLNGYTTAYPTAAQGALGNPNNALNSLVACCQYVNSDYLNRGEILKAQYHFSPTTSFTGAYIGIQSQYDGPSSGFIQQNDVFAPAAQYAGSGQLFAPGQSFLMNAKTTLPDARLYDNEPMFEGELRTAVGNDTLLGRFYSGILARQTTSDLSAPSANYTTGPMTLWGTATIGGATVPFEGTSATVTVPTPYSNSVEHDQLRGGSFEWDHPIGDNLLTVAIDRNTSLTNAYAVTGNANNPLGTRSTSIAAGTRQDFTTYLLRGTFAVNPKTQLTLANYFNTYRSTYTPATTSGVFTFATVTTMHDDPRIGLTYRASPQMTLRFSAGSAIAPPYPALIDNLNTTPAQAYTSGSTSVTIAQNSGTLLPETSFGYDIGGDVRVGGGAILSADAYLTNLHDQFVGVVYPSGTTFTPPGGSPIPVYITTNQNISQSRFEGLEATLTKDPAVGWGYTVSGALQRAYAYDISPSFYTTAAGGFTTNLGVVDGSNFDGFNTPFFNGISNKSEAYSQGYASAHVRGSHGQYALLGATLYGSNNTYNIPAFYAWNASYRQPLGSKGLSLQLSGDNIFNADSLAYVQYGTGIGAPLANGQYGLRSTVPYGPATFRMTLTREF